MSALTEAVLAGADPQALLAAPVPTHYRAAHLRKADVGIFGADPDKDVRRSIHIGDVPMPDLAPDEVLVAVMASAINFNTVWSATFEPLPTFKFLARHDPRHPVIKPGRVAAFAVPGMESERLVVVIERGGGAADDEIVRATRAAVKRHHDLRVHEVVLAAHGAVRRTSSGKLARHATREWYLASTR